MKTDKLVAWIACLLLAGSVATGAARAAESARSPTPPPFPALERKVVVYYFYNKVRCVSCRNIEQYTGEALRAHFAPRLKSGEVEWRPVNLDAEGNAHYETDYQLYTKSVVLSEVVAGKEKSWRNLTHVWTLLGDKEAFQDYVRTELQKLLDARAAGK